MVDASSDGGPARLIDPLAELMGESTAMVALRAQVRRLVQMQSSARRLPAILLVGETGTGKGLLARAIHRAGPRATGPFQAINCAALPEHLVEAELFGFEPGAFTDARRAKPGLFEIAGGGTLFLDEVAELPPEVQPKLLRALADREIRRVGEAAPRSADVRVIAATHANLEGKVASGELRDHLFYRLAVLSVRVPPLRERMEDIPLLVERFLSTHRPPRALSDLPPHVMELLSRHSWPGNVRELRNVVARLALFPELGPSALETVLPRHPDVPAELVAQVLQLPWSEARERVLEEFERQYLGARLKEHGGNVSAAARAMGISRQLTHKLLSRAGLKGGEAGED